MQLNKILTTDEQPKPCLPMNADKKRRGRADLLVRLPGLTEIARFIADQREKADRQVSPICVFPHLWLTEPF
jgi:hypothetical protein